MTFLDIIQAWNYEHENDLNDLESLFEDIVLDERVDKTTMVGVLLDECGAMESLYNTTPTFKFMSDNFFKKYQWNITKLADTLDFEYDPLKNKNVEWTETTTIEQNLDTEEEHNENKTRSNTGTQTTNETGTQTNEFDGDETNTISAMNSNTYEPNNKTTTDNSNTRTDNLQKQRTDNLLEGEQKAGDRNKSEDLTWDETDTHTESGNNNIPYQDLIEKERKVAQFSLYVWIAKKYKNELFLLVY